MVSISQYTFGEEDYLLKINVPVKEISKNTIWYPIVILDTSGSMTRYAKLSIDSIMKAFSELRYDPNSPVSLITFSDDAKLLRVHKHGESQIKDLANLRKQVYASGTTMMSGVIRVLHRLLERHKRLPVVIIAISDGEISDQEEVVKKSESTFKLLEPFNFPLEVMLLRLKTVDCAEPDTRALCTIGALSNLSAVDIVDFIPAGMTDQEVVNILGQTIVSAIHKTRHSMVKIQGSELKHLPHDRSSDTLHANCDGNPIFMTSKNSHVSLKIDSEDISVDQFNVQNIRIDGFGYYLERIEQKLRMWLLMDTHKEDSKKIIEWLNCLDQHIIKVTSSVDPTDVSIKGRAMILRNRIATQSSTLQMIIQQTQNAERVRALNSQQQADWLRSLSENASSRRLAKRVAKKGEFNFNEVSRKALRALAHIQTQIPKTIEQPVRSYYSMSTPMECLMSSIELVDVVDDLSAPDIMTCVGGVGVPFLASIKDYPDPFALRINEIYSGIYLAESDLCFLLQQNSDPFADISCPGRNDSDKFTGILTLRCLDENVYKILTSPKVLPYWEIQVGFQIRRTLAPVQHDIIALNAAVAWYLFKKFFKHRQLSSIEDYIVRAVCDNLTYLMQSIYTSKRLRQLFDRINNEPDIRPWLSGEDGVSSILQPIAVLIGFRHDFNAEKIKHVMRSLYCLNCYHALKVKHGSKSADQGNVILDALLNVDFKTQGLDKVAIDVESEERYFPENFSCETSKIPANTPSAGGFLGLYSFLTEQTQFPGFEEVFGMNEDLLLRVGAAQALKCKHEHDRIDTVTRVCRFPDPENNEKAMEYLRSEVHQRYLSYNASQMVKAKRTKLRKQVLQDVSTLIESGSIQNFVNYLLSSPINGDHHPGYKLLIHDLINSKDDNKNLIMDKLSFLLLGKDITNESSDEWLNGNLQLRFWKTITRYICSLPNGQERTRLLSDERKLARIRVYRNERNRHGHSNQFPSYFAKGYKTLLHLEQSISLDEFKLYLKEHCFDLKCCRDFYFYSVYKDDEQYKFSCT